MRVRGKHISGAWPGIYIECARVVRNHISAGNTNPRCRRTHILVVYAGEHMSVWAWLGICERGNTYLGGTDIRATAERELDKRRKVASSWMMIMAACINIIHLCLNFCVSCVHPIRLYRPPQTVKHVLRAGCSYYP